MKIADISTIALEIPFTHGGRPYGFGGRDWTTLSVLMVRVETDDGLVGFGEAFSYNCLQAVRAAVEHTVAPVALGRDASDIAALMRDLQQRLHLFGRYGITLFALSGLDIALWDIAGKAAGLPLGRLLGGADGKRLPGYASLFHYTDPEIVASQCAAALEQGFAWIKLHEKAEREVRAARECIGDDVGLMVDTNCPWTPEQARANAERLEPYGLHWLEEPIFPPEDFDALAALRRRCGIPIAAGENACTAFEFRKMLAAGAVDFAQPSVTKVGGVTELMKVATLTATAGVSVMPHAPYFGPGFLASLQAMSALAEPGLVERLHVTPEACLYGDLIDTDDGTFTVPSGPGLGLEPDPGVMTDYAARAD